MERPKSGTPCTLRNWSVGSHPHTDPFIPPEHRGVYLHGEVYGHPYHEDGKEVTTSRILSADGKVITCRSRQYILGEPDPKYLKFLSDIEYPYEEKNPIKIY